MLKPFASPIEWHPLWPRSAREPAPGHRALAQQNSQKCLRVTGPAAIEMEESR